MVNTQFLRRVAYNLMIIIMLITLPWWWAGFFALLGLFIFPKYIEVMFIGMLLDGVYSGYQLGAIGLPWATVVGLVGFTVVWLLQPRIPVS